MIRWAYGVTTVPERKNDLLPRTLLSLSLAGFDQPRLFVDGIDHAAALSYEALGLAVTARTPPRLRVAGNWVLALYELYYRQPEADLFALFQDDLVTYPNLRRYLERNRCPDKGYMNLYTFPSNQELSEGKVGWFKSREISSPPGFQTGRGAVGLVFPKDAVIILLSQRGLVDRVQDPHRGHKKIDGGVVDAMNRAGWTEYVHNPSLLQHTGHHTTCGNLPHLQATSFRGESFDALQLIQETDRAAQAHL